MEQKENTVNITSKEMENKREKLQSVVLKVEHEMDFRTKEAYKTLRANLEFAGDDVKGYRQILQLTRFTHLNML